MPRQAKLLEFDFFYKKTLPFPVDKWSKQGGEIMLSVGQFAQCLAVNEAPAVQDLDNCKIIKPIINTISN